MGDFGQFLIFFAVLAAWFVLNRWVLPWCGISTCMSGSCAVGPRPSKTEKGRRAESDSGDKRHEIPVTEDKESER